MTRCNQQDLQLLEISRRLAALEEKQQHGQELVGALRVSGQSAPDGTDIHESPCTVRKYITLESFGSRQSLSHMQERNVLHELDRFRNGLDSLSDQLAAITRGTQVRH